MEAGSSRPRRVPSPTLPTIMILGIPIQIRTSSMMTTMVTPLNSHKERQRANRGPIPSLYLYVEVIDVTMIHKRTEGGQAVGGL